MVHPDPRHGPGDPARPLPHPRGPPGTGDGHGLTGTVTSMPDTPFVPAPVIVADEPGSFPHGVLAERHPAIVRQVRDAFPLDPERRHALDALLAGCADGVVEPLPADADPTGRDRDRWARWGMDAYAGRSWYDVPWLWAESHFYRRLLDAVGYFGPGAWQGVDPFRPAKLAELAPGVHPVWVVTAQGAALLPSGTDHVVPGTRRYWEV
ncbi:hypothetical protein ACKI1J_46155, partial [Streptomyces scabiei]